MIDSSKYHNVIDSFCNETENAHCQQFVSHWFKSPQWWSHRTTKHHLRASLDSRFRVCTYSFFCFKVMSECEVFLLLLATMVNQNGQVQNWKPSKTPIRRFFFLLLTSICTLNKTEKCNCLLMLLTTRPNLLQKFFFTAFMPSKHLWQSYIVVVQ